MKNQQIKQIQIKIQQINTFINNWKQEILNYENTIQQLTEQVSKLINANDNINK